MAISPILLNGSIQQTDNVLHNQMKQVEKGKYTGSEGKEGRVESEAGCAF